MQTRTLGQSLIVSEQGLGCMSMSHVYGFSDDTEARGTLRRALDMGLNFFDTADVYGPFTNEVLLGEVLGSNRNDAIIATKFGNETLPDGGGVRVNGRPEYVRSACEASLNRLGTDYIDLYYQHRVDRGVPVEETWGAMKALVNEGKVRYLGISEAAPETIRRAHAVHPMTAIQSEYSLWSRDVEDNGVLEVARELGIGFVPFSPIGRGFFAGNISNLQDLSEIDYRRKNPRFQGENLALNLQRVRSLQKISAAKGVSPIQLALAWVLSQGQDIVPIPGTKRIAYLEENVAASGIEITAQDQEQLDLAFPKGSTAGPRYLDMSTVYV